MSAEAPKYPPQVQGGNPALEQDLGSMGLKFDRTRGKYEVPENSYVIYGPTREQMVQLGQRYGQESVVHVQDGQQHLVYSSGPDAGKHRTGMGYDFFPQEPDDYYTLIPGHGFLRINFDFDKPPEGPGVQQPNGGPGASASLSKSEAGLGEHPHVYPWLASHTDHAMRHSGQGVLISGGRPLKKAEGDHQDADSPSPSTYARIAAPFGQVRPGIQTNLAHYPLGGQLTRVRQLVASYGYTPFYAGGRFGRPDLANRNYNTKHLPIFDAGTGFGADSTESWRLLHELSHALTEGGVNLVHGDGRRVGKLGSHRTLHDAIRAVHWEDLACQKQRELTKQLGIGLSDQAYERERNTVLHDAVHRAVTGQPAQPSASGFAPHDRHVPLDVALKLVKDSAAQMGLTSLHQLLSR